MAVSIDTYSCSKTQPHRTQNVRTKPNRIEKKERDYNAKSDVDGLNIQT